jgi:hypothetical protein
MATKGFFHPLLPLTWGCYLKKGCQAAVLGQLFFKKNYKGL